MKHSLGWVYVLRWGPRSFYKCELPNKGEAALCCAQKASQFVCMALGMGLKSLVVCPGNTLQVHSPLRTLGISTLGELDMREEKFPQNSPAD